MTGLDGYRRVIAFYGDDFTGSTDVMESLTSNGLPAVLFLEPPDEERLAGFAEYRAVGVAGISRSRSPQWMKENLRPALCALKRVGAPLIHYKVCSTFDSSPEVGSIGCAIEIGRDVFGSRYVPLVAGAPILKRYTVFGNHFATVGDDTFRLDRHPTMTRHPVTPMHEADLRRHLAFQTDLRIELVDILALQSVEPERRLDAVLDCGAEIVLFDVLDDASLESVGRLLWERRPSVETFVVGSSGLEYALVAHWRATEQLPSKTEPPPVGGSDRLLVVSGSCAPTTEQQIRWAKANGFIGIRLDITKLSEGQDSEAIAAATRALKQGRSVVLYSALGPQDQHFIPSEKRHAEFSARLGRSMGAMVCRLIEESGIRRLVVCGGDTSGHVGNMLGIYALSMLGPLAPGAPLCRAHSEDARFDGLEIVFKGGQNGNEQFFQHVQQGGVS